MHNKNKKYNKNFVHDECKKFNGWAEAIKAAKLQLPRAQVAEREMRAVIELFNKKMKAGEPWPGQAGYTITQTRGA